MGRLSKETEIARKEAVDQKIADGVTDVRDIAHAVHGKFGFDGTFNGTYAYIREFFANRGLPVSKARKATELVIEQAIAQKLNEGLVGVTAITKALLGTPGFEDIGFSTTYSRVYQYHRNQGILTKVPPQKEQRPSTANPAARIGIPVSVIARKAPIQNFVDSYQIRLPLGQADEFSRFVKALLSVALPLEAEAARVPGLEQKIRDLEEKVRDLESRSPDEKLREENTRLRNMIEAKNALIEKWKMDKGGYNSSRVLTAEEHLATSAGRD